jgi:phosphoglycerate kinase
MIYESIKSISDADVKNKKVFVRLDFDVPIKNGQIEDDSRLLSGLETVKYLLEKDAVVVAAGHIGRPEGEDPKFSCEIVAKWFHKKFLDTSLEPTEVEGLKGWKLSDNLFVLENLRFDPGEEKNDSDFSQKLAATAQIYVNESFGVAHRAHASITGVAKLLPHYAGYHLMHEVKVLSKTLTDPKRPLTIIIGGAKIETKLPLISKMHRFADYVLVGGELAEQTKVLVKEAHEKISGQKAMLIVADLTSDKFDITPNSVENFEQAIDKSATIVWNGPMGFIEEGHTQATVELAKVLNKSSAYKIIGGGDTIGFLSGENLVNHFDLVSVGGGAMLEFLAGEKLPGLVALEN